MTLHYSLACGMEELERALLCVTLSQTLGSSVSHLCSISTWHVTFVVEISIVLTNSCSAASLILARAPHGVHGMAV